VAKDYFAEIGEKFGIANMTVHKDAAMFPMLSEKEMRTLADDIKAHGLQEPVTIKGSELWDGRNRLMACHLAGVKPDFKEPPKGTTARDFIISANINRRHLSPAQKREMVELLVKAAPEKSDRQIAKTAKVSHHTVAKARKKEEGRGHIAHAVKRTDSAGRKQPATKPATKKPYKNVANELLPRPNGSAEINPEERSKQNVAIAAAEDIGKSRSPNDAVAQFRVACVSWFGKMNPDQKQEAIAFFIEFTKPLTAQAAVHRTLGGKSFVALLARWGMQ
jgi:ParB-like chromosome segregation protein Spo0J